MVALGKEAIEKGSAVSGRGVQRVVFQSYAPVEVRQVYHYFYRHRLIHRIQNAFSKRLSSTGFNIFSALVVDILHEYEIGVWKALFLHLIRLLDACGTGTLLVSSLNQR